MRTRHLDALSGLYPSGIRSHTV